MSRLAGRRVSMVVWNTFENDARVLKEAETLQAAGMGVTVFALHTPGETRAREVVGNGVRVVRVLRSPGMLFRRRRLRSTGVGERPVDPTQRGKFRLLLLVVSRVFTHFGLLFRMLQSRPDVVHAHDVNVLVTAWLASRLARAKLVYDAHEVSTDREGYRGVRRWVGAIERRLMPAAAATITTTALRAKFFARAYDVPRPMVLQNRPRYAGLRRGNRLREELELHAPWPIVLYQGGLQAGRGLEYLVRAAGEVPETWFVLIGSGRLAGRLQELAASPAIGGRVRIIPTVPLAELPAYTASADIGVQPLRNTCFNHWSTDSNKLFEYAMAGLPVLASDFPEIRKIVKRHELGLLFDPEVPGALARGLRKLVDSAELRRRFSQNAINSRRELSWEAQEHKLVDLYEKVFGKPR